MKSLHRGVSRSDSRAPKAGMLICCVLALSSCRSLRKPPLGSFVVLLFARARMCCEPPAAFKFPRALSARCPAASLRVLPALGYTTASTFQAAANSDNEQTPIEAEPTECANWC